MAKRTRRKFSRKLPPWEDLPDLLKVDEVAQLFRVSPLTIKRWGKKGILTPVRINSRGDRRYFKSKVKEKLGL